MSFLSGIVKGGAEGLLNGVKNLADEFITSQEEKLDFVARFEALAQKRDSEIEQTLRVELNAKMSVMVAELQQGDAFTKRARPSIVYFGLFAIFCNYMLAPAMQAFGGVAVTPFPLPVEFWATWGGVCGAYVIGRSTEKRGASNRATELLTGSGSHKFMELLK